MKTLFLVTLAAVTLFGSSTAFASTSSKSELVVRYNTQAVVKLSYRTPQEAQAARAELILDPAVERVAPNFRYQLALHLQERVAPETRTFLGLPFAGDFWAGSDTPTANPEIPDAILPGPVTAGVDPLTAQDWAIQAIDMPSVQAVQAFQSSQPLIAAVIDTGVDYNHEDLVGAMWRDPSDPQSVGYDFVHNTNKPYDVKHFDMEGCLKDKSCLSGDAENRYLTNPGHGTHCAGHVGAVANNSLGIRGVGGNVQVMALKFFYDYTDGANAGGGDDAAAVQAIDYAIAHGVKVISASWGSRMTPRDAEQSELKAALTRARQAGVLFVVAAGNNGIDNDTDPQPTYPANYASKDGLDNILVVSASDDTGALADFSSYGAHASSIAAPGVKIFSTTVGSTYNDVVTTYSEHGGHEQKEMDWDGTSMATPIVAGAAALIWSKYPDENYLQIKNRILQSARPVAALHGKVSSEGVLDVSAALGL